MPVLISRNGHEQTVNVTLAEATAERGPRGSRGTNDDEDSNDNATSSSALGITVSPVSPDSPRNGRSVDGDDVKVSGLLVNDVDPDGRAADAGIQPGDVIVEVNRQPVRTVEQLKSAVHTKSDKPLLFLVNRNGRDTFLSVRPNS